MDPGLAERKAEESLSTANRSVGRHRRRDSSRRPADDDIPPDYCSVVALARNLHFQEFNEFPQAEEFFAQPPTTFPPSLTFDLQRGGGAEVEKLASWVSRNKLEISRNLVRRRMRFPSFPQRVSYLASSNRRFFFPPPQTDGKRTNELSRKKKKKKFFHYFPPPPSSSFSVSPFLN